MATINSFQCLADAGNTGVVPCFLDVKNIVGAILAPKGSEIDVTSLQTNLIAKTHFVTKAGRYYPIYDFETTTDATEQKVVQNQPTGQKHVVREGFNDWSFAFVDGGLSLSKQIRKFNGSNWDFYFIDAQGVIYGIAGSTSDMLKAIPSDGGFFWCNPYKLNDGSKITEYSVQFVFKTTYANDLLVGVQADFDFPTTVKGLQNVTLSNPSATTAGLFRVKAVRTDTQGNLGDEFATELAVTSAWVIKNAATGAIVTTLSATYDVAGGYFIVGATTGDTDYPTPPAPVTINLGAPAVLQGLGVDGYESTGAISIATVA